jgi:hypothetical protein
MRASRVIRGINMQGKAAGTQPLPSKRNRPTAYVSTAVSITAVRRSAAVHVGARGRVALRDDDAAAIAVLLKTREEKKKRKEKKKTIPVDRASANWW